MAAVLALVLVGCSAIPMQHQDTLTRHGSQVCHAEDIPSKEERLLAPLGWIDRGCHGERRVLGPGDLELLQTSEGEAIGEQMYTGVDRSPCPSKRDLTNIDEALEALPDAGFDCVEKMAMSLADHAGRDEIRMLIQASHNGDTPWARRNALRVLGDFCWTASKCQQMGGVGCRMNRPCALLLVGEEKKPYIEALKARIKHETDDKPLDDALWLASIYFKPFGDLKSRYEKIIKDKDLPPVTRVRAVQQWHGIVSAQKNQSQADVDFLTTELQNEIPAISRILTVTAQYVMDSLTDDQKPVVKIALENVVKKDGNLVDKIDAAQAVDRYKDDDTQSAKLKGWIQDSYFNVTVHGKMKGSRITVRTSFPVNETECWLGLVQREWQAFEDILGPEFQKPLADASFSHNGTCGPINILVMPNQKAYHSYMTAFVGFAANAGGLYVKKYNTLFTYQRTEQESFISVEELILHEFGHYLQKCYMLPGVFGTEEYDKEPKGVLDEGLAEFWATLNFNSKGCYSMPLRGNYMKRICRNRMYPQWDLRKLIHERKGYDERGVFHYMEGYTLNYFLATQHIDVLRKILKHLRHDDYDADKWKNETGKTIDEWSELWKAALKEFCDSSHTQEYPTKCLQDGDNFPTCSVHGHGYHTKLWHTAQGLDSESARRRRTAFHMGVDADLGASDEKGQNGEAGQELGEGSYLGDGYSDMANEFGEASESVEDIRETQEELVEESDRPLDLTADPRGMMEDHESADLGPQRITNEPADINELLGPTGPQPF